MNVLHICSIDNDKNSGMCNVVPYHYIYQKKYANAAIINCNSTKVNLLSNEKNYYNIEDINNDIFSIPCFNKKIDIVIFHGVYIPKYLVISKQLRKNKIPYVIIPHGSLTENAQNIKHLKKVIGNYLLFNKFIYNALRIQYLSDNEKKMSNKFKNNSFVSGNGMLEPNKRKESFSSKGLKLVYIGRYSIFIKGIDIIIEACSIIKDFLIMNNIKVALYGSHGDGIEKLQNIINEKELNDVITVNNSIYDKEKEDTILSNDIFIQTSRFEGQPLGIMEAMFLGMPVIISDGTSFGKIVRDNNCGYVGNNPSEISNIIIECFTNKDILSRMSSNSYIYAKKHFIWNNVAKNTLKEYRKILNEMEG